MDFLEVLASATVPPDERDGRIYGLLYGSVTDVNDPKGLGRVKARVGSQQDQDTTDWLDPAWPGSIEAIPVKGEPLFVAFIDGDPNRGVYWWHPTSKTQNRAQDFMLLGTTFVGMFNFLVDQFNQLRSDFHNHVHAFGTLQCSNGTISGSTASKPTTANAANKGKAADGSVVGNQTSSVTVLSGRAKVK